MVQHKKIQTSVDRITKTQELIYEISIGEAMTTNVITVRPDQTMSELRFIMRDNRISGTPVVENGKLVGIISIEDLINALLVSEINATIREKMTKEVMCLYEDELLVHCITKLSKSGFSRYPVLNRDGNLVGIITKGNVVEALLRKLEIELQITEDKRVATRREHPAVKKIFEDVDADKIEFRFKFHVEGQTLKNAGKAASELRKALRQLGICPPLLRRIGVATYEAEINITSYTQGGEICALVEKHGITVDAIDNGPGIPDIDLALQPGYSTAPDWVREFGFGAGMGLVNIQKCADEMELRSSVPDGTHLTMRFYYTN